MLKAVAVLRLLILVPIAYGSACIVAALIPTIVLSPVVSLLGSILILVTAILSAWVFAMLGLVPMLLLVVLAELMGWRSVLFWVPAGPAIGLLFFIPGAGLYVDLLGELGVIPTNLSAMLPASADPVTILALTVVGGLLGGLVYWSMAGRYSGLRGGRR